MKGHTSDRMSRLSAPYQTVIDQEMRCARHPHYVDSAGVVGPVTKVCGKLECAARSGHVSECCLPDCGSRQLLSERGVLLCLRCCSCCMSCNPITPRTRVLANSAPTNLVGSHTNILTWFKLAYTPTPTRQLPAVEAFHVATRRRDHELIPAYSSTFSSELP
jgi:hypothetical protein